MKVFKERMSLEVVSPPSTAEMTLDEALKEYFGFDSFKGMQRDVIESLMSGHQRR